MTMKSDLEWITAWVNGQINHWHITMNRIRRSIEQVEKDKSAFEEFIRNEAERNRIK